MMKRYSPLAGLAERRLRLGAITDKDKEPAAGQALASTATEVDEFTWNTVRDLTRDTGFLPAGDVPSPKGAAASEQAAVGEKPQAAATDADATAPEADGDKAQSDDVPAAETAPAAEPQKRRSSRVKTTLLGFDRSDGRTEELFKDTVEKKTSEVCKFPTGWLVVTEGPGRGTAVALHEGVSQIGRGDDQAIQLDFGDNSISRENHAAVAYDEETRTFYLGHGGKTNIVRLNGTPVLSTEPLNHDDLIRIGETTMRFVAFCNSSFSWSDKKSD